MAVQSFWVSVELTPEEKERVQAIVRMPHRKKSDELIYKNTLCIEDVNMTEEKLREVKAIVRKRNKGAPLPPDLTDAKPGFFWHINVGLYDLFHGLETLYELLGIIRDVKGEFPFFLLGEERALTFTSLFEFIEYVYPKIESYKRVFEARYGVLSVHPQEFFAFRRKNAKRFENWLGIPKEELRILRLNGWDRLEPDLQRKYWAFHHVSRGEKIATFFSLDEFRRVLEAMTILYFLYYNGVEYAIGIDGVWEESYAFYCETAETERYAHFSSVEELLENAKMLDGKLFTSVWNELTVKGSDDVD